MTRFEAWTRACEELDQEIYFLDGFKNCSGDTIELYLVVKVIPQIKIIGLNVTSERYYMLWINRERLQSFTDYEIAISEYQRRCNGL